MTDIFSASTRSVMRDIILATDERWANFQLDQRLNDLGFLKKEKKFLCVNETISALDLLITNIHWNNRESVLPFVRLLESSLATGDMYQIYAHRLQQLLTRHGYKLKHRKIYRHQAGDERKNLKNNDLGFS
jgi:hypothetical protein